MPALLLLMTDRETGVNPRKSKILPERIADLGGKQQMKMYTRVGHTDIIMANARPFRMKSPVFADVTSFVYGQLHQPDYAASNVWITSLIFAAMRSMSAVKRSTSRSASSPIISKICGAESDNRNVGAHVPRLCFKHLTG